MEESSSVDKWRRKRKFALTSSSLHQEKAMISYGYIRDTSHCARLGLMDHTERAGYESK